MRSATSASIGPADREHIALGEQRRNVARQRAGAERARTKQHVRESWMDRQRIHLTALCGDAAVRIERVELAQQLLCLRERARRRRIDPRQLERIVNAGGGEIERERREIGAGDLRRRVREEMRRLVLRPQAIADAGSEPPGATATLVGRRARDAHRLEARHASSR